MASLSFTALWPLALLAALPLIWWLRYRSTTNLSPRHLDAAMVLRAAAFALVVLALARPVWQAATRDVSVVYALDVSRSVAPTYIESALRWIREANRSQAPSTARYVAFADHAVLFDDLEQLPKLAVTADASAPAGALQQGATDIEAALDQALLGFDADQVKRLVLLTDGNQTRGDVWQVLPRLQAEGVRVYAFPATVRAQNDAWIEAIEAPNGVRRDEPVGISVRVVSQAQAQASVRLTSAGSELGRQHVRLRAGLNTVVFNTRIRQQGAVELQAEVKAEADTIADNDRLARSLWVAPRPRVLYAEGQSGSADYLREALTREGMEVKAIGPAELPTDAASLTGYDAVIVSDVPRSDADDARLRALESYVRDQGGSLIYASGESTYGKDGFSGTPLERVLPVEFKAQEKRKDLALVVCLDRSYSMKGRSMELAKAGARAALDILEEQHQFGVIAFDSQPHEVVPLAPVRSKRRAEDLIDRIQASGQTNIYTALAIAYRWLQNATPKSRHVILLSDGDTAPADFERLLKRMIDAHITVSTVAIGNAADRELMDKIAHWGKGRAYFTEDVSRVPQIFIEDTQNMTRATLIEEPFRPVVKHKIEALRGIDFAKAPMLGGFASTKLRDGAEVFLESESGAPILSRWQYGLGRSAAFASDVKNRWAAEWLRWDGYGKFWAQVTRDIMRRDTGEELRLGLRRDGDVVRVTLEAQTRDGAWQNELSPAVRVTQPGGGTELLQLRQRAPGSYGATLPSMSMPGSQPISFQLEAGGGIGREAARGTGAQRLYYPYSDEYRSLPPDMPLLHALAQQTGGKVAPTTQEIFATGRDRGHTQHALWPWLAAVALLLYLGDIALRRGLLAVVQRRLRRSTPS
jgi:Ca-activated chloride channel family protein